LGDGEPFQREFTSFNNSIVRNAEVDKAAAQFCRFVPQFQVYLFDLASSNIFRTICSSSDKYSTAITVTQCQLPSVIQRRYCGPQPEARCHSE
jgi:hypothetical protein